MSMLMLGSAIGWVLCVAVHAFARWLDRRGTTTFRGFTSYCAACEAQSPVFPTEQIRDAWWATHAGTAEHREHMP